MNSMIKLMTTLLVLNIFMYLGVNFSISADGSHSLNKDYNFHFNGDLIDTYLSGNTDLDQIAQDTKENYTSYGVGLNSSFTLLPEQSRGISTGSGGINFLDSLKIAWYIVPTIANIIIAPMTLFFNFRMPVFVGLMIGIPYVFILVLCFFAFLRGVSD